MKLYKYYSVNGDNLSALINRQFWASKPGSFNDPYDSPVNWTKVRSHPIWMRPDGNGNLVSWASHPNPPPPIFRNFTESEIQEVEKSGVVCFSSKCDEMLLWSHYADQHRGYSLEFDVPDDSFNTISRRLREVEYIETFESVLDFGCTINVAAYKHKAWKYEEEYRLIVNEGNALYPWSELRYFENLSGIIFGTRAKQSHVHALKKVVMGINPNITLMNAVLSEDQFQIQVAPVP